MVWTRPLEGGVLLCLTLFLCSMLRCSSCYYKLFELSCCCCYLKTGPSAIDLKPQHSQVLASHSALWEPDRPNPAKTTQRLKLSLSSHDVSSVTLVGRFLPFLIIVTTGLDFHRVLWLSSDVYFLLGGKGRDVRVTHCQGSRYQSNTEITRLWVVVDFD